ncbi:MAG TPA: hypothetical protein VFC82_05910 [Actinomycetaceae bacterium]|nr:hypothetical protein [Actinomycetaceae bacterium]
MSRFREHGRPGDARVDVIIAAHSPARPVARAACSIADGNPEARAVVVCHNTSVESVAVTMSGDLAARVTFLELNDGIPSPSGPFNHGIRRSGAEFVSIMGSDDMLDRGAVANWLAEADRWDADAVVTRLVRGDDRDLVRSPAVRLCRRGPLDIVRDRLPYRSAPLGLVRRDAVDTLGLALTPGARNGGDLEFVSRLWAGGRVVYAGKGPGYVEMGDARDRVTHVRKPIAEELSPVRSLLNSPWFQGQPSRVRRAIGVKLLRRNVIDAIVKRPRPGDWQGSDATDLADLAGRILRGAPGTWELLSSREVRLLGAVHDSRAGELPELAAAAKSYRHPGALLGPDLRSWFHPAGAARYAIAAALLR